MRKFKVLHVVSKLPPGGVEWMIYKIVTNYSENFIPIVCCIKEGGYVAEKIREKGIKVHILNCMKKHKFDFQAIWKIYNLIKQEKIDILRTHQYHANLYGRIAGILAGVPVILPSFHSLYVSSQKPKIHRRIFNFFLSKFSDYLIAVSKAVAKDVVKFDKVNPSKIKIIYNGIPIGNFNIDIDKNEARKLFNLTKNKIIIGTVGRLVPEKGHVYLIEAVSGLKNVSIAIAGDGELKDYLQEKAIENKVELFLLGNLEQSKIPLFLKAIDIFCFPSLREGFSNALLEALSSELPIAASNIPSIVEALNDSALYFLPKNVESLRECLMRLITSEKIRKDLSLKAKKRAEIFSIENTVKNYEDLFLEILKKKGLL